MSKISNVNLYSAITQSP